MITDAQIEAAARSIAESLGRAWGSADARTQDGWRQMARAALEAAERAAWQPIETAPKDGTPILIRFRHANYKFAGDRRDEWEEVCVARWIDHNGGGWTWHGICGAPTHFRPLPQPPGEEETR